MKKIIAGLIAFLMAFAAVGCGKIDDEKSGGSEEKTSESRGEESSEDTSSEEGSDDGNTESTEESKADSDGNSKPAAAIPAANGFVNESNLLIVDKYQSDDNDAYDTDVLCLVMEKAIEQYNCIIDRDADGYINSLNFKKLVNSNGLEIIAKDEYNDLPDAELSVYYIPLLTISDVMQDEISKLESQYSSSGNENESDLLSAVFEMMKEKTDSMTADDYSKTDLMNEYSAYNYNFGGIEDEKEVSEAVPEDFAKNYANYRYVHDDSAIYGIEIDEYASNERGVFMELDMVVACGDWEYIFDEVHAWIIDGEVGIMIDNFSIEENEVKGMTLDEIRERMDTNTYTVSSNTNAKTAYNAAAVYLADREVEGVSFEEVMKNGEFRDAEGDETLGLSLSLTKAPDKKGDAFLFNSMHDIGITTGFVYLGVINYKNMEFFIQYIDENGHIGQYPHPINNSDSGKVVFGTYYVNSDN